jgi:hypothetical protein
MTLRTTSHLALVLATALLATACGSMRPAPSVEGGDRAYGSGTVVRAQQLAGGGVNLLDALVGRVSNLRVDRGDRCPRVTFRGQRSMMQGGSPSVYVDRSRFSDTCVLDQIRPRHVSRVEIDPNGHTTRPGYAPNAQGLILVFLTRRAALTP